MGWLPKLRQIPQSRQMINVFSGYNHNLRIGDGEFYDMKNMTADHYPVLATRRKRIYGKETQIVAMGVNHGLCKVYKDCVVLPNNKEVEYDGAFNSSNEPEQWCLSMAGFLLVLPWRLWINVPRLMGPEFDDVVAMVGEPPYGSMDYSYSPNKISFSMCTADGTACEADYVGEETPEEPENGALWIDTSGEIAVLKKWYENSSQWAAQTAYIRVECGVNPAYTNLAAGDGIRIQCDRTDFMEAEKKEAFKYLMTTADEKLDIRAVVQDSGKGFFTIQGILAKPVSFVFDDVSAYGISVKRHIPDMDYMTVSGNRLWGCRHGLSADGKMVNEIYCSKLGDFKNFEVFEGISTDSWAVSLGSDGEFTGAATFMGHPVFFKENRIIRILGDYPKNFTVQEDICEGVHAGCHKSIAEVDGVLYYKGRTGIWAYNGSMPVCVSQALGDVRYESAVGGAADGKYYLSMVGQGRRLFVYDTRKRIWCVEDELDVNEFHNLDGSLYALLRDGNTVRLNPIEGGYEADFPWFVQTGQIGISLPAHCRISRIVIRLQMDAGAAVACYGQYDFDEIWKPLFHIQEARSGIFTVPVRPERCGAMKLRLEGTGGVKIYSITYLTEQGSDIV